MVSNFIIRDEEDDDIVSREPRDECGSCPFE